MPATRPLLAIVIVSIAVGGCSSDLSRLSASPSSTASPGSTTGGAPAPSVRATPGRPVVAPGEAWIAFQRDIGRAEVGLIRPDGSDLHSPTGEVSGTDQTNPDWSPDGLQLVFGVTSDGRDDLWTVAADGSGARLLVDCEAPCMYVDDPDWSPDGQSVLFSRLTEADGKAVGTLEVIHLDQARTEVLLTAGPMDFFAGQRWSPDGRSVVLEVVHRVSTDAAGDIDGVTLSVVDLTVAAPAPRGLTDPALFAATADWSPDGAEIVYSALVDAQAPAPDLFAIRPDGTGLRRLTTLAEAGGSAAEPDVSPDGVRIVFVAQLMANGPGVLAAIPRGGGEAASATGASFIEGRHPRLRPTP